MNRIDPFQEQYNNLVKKIFDHHEGLFIHTNNAQGMLFHNCAPISQEERLCVGYLNTVDFEGVITKSELLKMTYAAGLKRCKEDCVLREKIRRNETEFSLLELVPDDQETKEEVNQERLSREVNNFSWLFWKKTEPYYSSGFNRDADLI